MESSRLKTSQHLSTIDPPSSKSPLVQWVGPIDAQWNWLRSNLNAEHGPIVGLDGTLANSPTNNPQHTPAESLPQCPGLGRDLIAGVQPKFLTAVNGRLDPLLDCFVDWESQWTAAEQTKVLSATKAKRSKKKPVATDGSVGLKSKATDPLEASYGSNRPFSDSYGLVLGEFWPGHRRTWPLPEWCVPFYWYELFDRILPWVHQNANGGSLNPSKTSTSRLGVSSTQSSRGRPNARIDSLLSHASSLTNSSLSTGALRGTNALVLSDTVTGSSLWENLFQPQDVNLVIAHPQAMNFRVDPDFVIIDVASPPRGRLQCVSGSISMDRFGLSKDWAVGDPQTARIDENLANIVAKVHSRYPNALIVALDAFPTWASWEIYLRQGADVLIPKPFHWYGLLWCLQYWLLRRRQVRINDD